MSLLLIAMLAGVWITGALADSLGPAQNASNDGTQDTKPSVAQDPQGNVHVVWDGQSGGTRTVRYAKGIWNGSGYNFSPSTEIANVGSFSYSTPSVAVSSVGTIMVGWSQSDGLRVQTWNASDGQPSGVAALIMPGLSSSIATDNFNRFHIVANGNFQVQYCQFENGQCTNSEAFASNQANRPHVAVDAGGNIHVVSDSGQQILYNARPAGGSFGGVQTLDSGNYASIAADGLGYVHIAYSSNYVIKYCQLAFGQQCTNQHTLQAGNQDIGTSIGATKDGAVMVGFRDAEQKLLWYDTRESGNWGGTRVLSNNGPTDPFVSPRPYTNRFSAVWSYNYQIQHIFDAVGTSITPTVTPSPTTPPTTPPAATLQVNGGNSYVGAQVSARITNTGGQATAYAITVNGQTVTTGAFTPDAAGGQTVSFTLPPTASCQVVTIAAVLNGPGGSSSPATANVTFVAAVVASASAVNPHLPTSTRPLGNIVPGAVIANYGDVAFTRERYAPIYIDAMVGECSGLNGFFLASDPNATVTSPTDPRWLALGYAAPVVNLPSSITDGQTYSFKVFLRDGAGNVTPNGIPTSITYDATPPAVVAGTNPVPTTSGGSGNDIAHLDLSQVQVSDAAYQSVRQRPYWGTSILVTDQPTIDSGDPAWDTQGVISPGVVPSTGLDWNLFFGNTTQPPAPGKPYYVHVRFIDGAGNVSSRVINSGAVTPRAFSSRVVSFFPFITR